MGDRFEEYKRRWREIAALRETSEKKEASFRLKLLEALSALPDDQTARERLDGLDLPPTEADQIWRDYEARKSTRLEPE